MLMTTVLHLLSGRKRKPVFIVVAWCALALLPGCASRKEFQKGFERGAADTVKRQYWMQQNLQKGEKASPFRLTIYRMPVAPDPDANAKTVPYEIAIPIYE